MVALSACAGQEWAVVGLGRAGFAMVEALIAGGATVLCWDDQPAVRAKASERGFRVMELQHMPWARLDGLVMSPGIPARGEKAHRAARLAAEHNVPMVGDAELLYRQRPGSHYFSITGTNGKSTVTELTGHILKQAGRSVAVGGNLGIPAVELPEAEDYVLELSSYQLELTDRFHPHVAILLNLSVDHQERHGSMEAYLAAKARSFLQQTTGDLAIIGVDDPWCRGEYQRQKLLAERQGFTVHAMGQQQNLPPDWSGCCIEGSQLLTRYRGREHRYDVSKAPSLQGPHNAQNAAAAVLAAEWVGIEPAVIQKALLTYHGLPHRMEEIAQHGMLRFINDSKATNADATVQALRSFEHIYWIAGGLAKEGDVLELAPFRERIVRAYLVGSSEETFAQLCTKDRVDHRRCGTLAKALSAAVQDAEAAGGPAVILLSPAAASMDQWKNFEERGNSFRDLVLARIRGKHGA